MKHQPNARRDDHESWVGVHLLTRRNLMAMGLAAGGSLALSTARPAESKFADAMPAAGTAGTAAGRGFAIEKEASVARAYPNVHGGAGIISVRFFPFDKQPAPAHFVIYDIPPGASEGVHTHHLGDSELGPFDEYYYIIEGAGEMPIDGRPVAVKAGDHVHTPLGVAHGIINTQSSGNLRVYVTFIARDG